MTAVFALYSADLPLEVVRDAQGFIERLETSVAIKKVLQKAVEWESEDRFASVVEFCEALAEARKSVPPHVSKNNVSSTVSQQEQDRRKDKDIGQEQDSFDVFLCHHSVDKPEVKKIGKQLRMHGLRPWLDEWELRPGIPWQRLLEEHIEKIKAVAVFVGPSGMGPWQQMELEAYLREFVNRECPVIPVILPGVSKVPRLPVFLSGMTWVDFRDSEPDPLKRLIWGITGEMRGIRITPPAGIEFRPNETATQGDTFETSPLTSRHLAELEDVKLIRLAITDPSNCDLVQVAKAIFRRIGVTRPELLDMPGFKYGTVWLVQLPKLALRLDSTSALLLLRSEPLSASFCNRLSDSSIRQSTAYTIVVDIADMKLTPALKDTGLIWFSPAQLMQVASVSSNERLSWMGRYILTHMQVDRMIPYQTKGPSKLYFGREWELQFLIRGKMPGGIVVLQI